MDVPLYAPFKLIESQQEIVKDWVLPLSKYQKIDGLWRLNKHQLLSGELDTQIYLLQTTDNWETVMNFYLTWAGKTDGDVLFSCKARSCGSSNDWANQFYENRRLNGKQGNQLFLSLKIQYDYLALYLVERPTGQKYLALKHLLSEPTAKAADQKVSF